MSQMMTQRRKGPREGDAGVRKPWPRVDPADGLETSTQVGTCPSAPCEQNPREEAPQQGTPPSLQREGSGSSASCQQYLGSWHPSHQAVCLSNFKGQGNHQREEEEKGKINCSPHSPSSLVASVLCQNVSEQHTLSPSDTCVCSTSQEQLFNLGPRHDSLGQAGAPPQGLFHRRRAVPNHGQVPARRQ